MSAEMKAIVQQLAVYKSEGDYWDFKREWHSNKTDLLHDIICMANNLANHDAYIIIGVDEKKGYAYTDVKNDPNRRNTQNLVDFLKDKSFAGGVRPRVIVQTVTIEGKEIDVIVVENSRYTPFFLTDRFEGVRANSIYARIVDTNTPIDMTADINHIEYLWKKRFGLTLTVMDRLYALLDDVEGWQFDWANKDYAFHINSPEFRMQRRGDYQKGWLPQAAFYAHPMVDMARLDIMYHSTVIYETEIWAFDQYRKYLPPAQNCRVKGKGDFWYSYYDLSKIEGKLLTIFTYGSNDCSSREVNRNQFLIFENDEERADYTKYLIDNFDRYSDEEIRERYKYPIQTDETEVGPGGFSAFQVGKAAALYEDWLNERALNY